MDTEFDRKLAVWSCVVVALLLGFILFATQEKPPNRLFVYETSVIFPSMEVYRAYMRDIDAAVSPIIERWMRGNGTEWDMTHAIQKVTEHYQESGKTLQIELVSVATVKRFLKKDGSEAKPRWSEGFSFCFFEDRTMPILEIVVDGEIGSMHSGDVKSNWIRR